MNDSVNAKLPSQVEPGQLIVKKVTSCCSCSLSQHNIAIKKGPKESDVSLLTHVTSSMELVPVLKAG